MKVYVVLIENEYSGDKIFIDIFLTKKLADDFADYLNNKSIKEQKDIRAKEPWIKYYGEPESNYFSEEYEIKENLNRKELK